MYNFSCILFYSCIIFLPHYSGFELAGLAPFSVRTIFQQETSWGKIPEEDVQRLIQAGVSQKNRNFLADFPEFLAEPEFRLTSASEPGPED